MSSNSDWLYKIDGDVFGPISVKELLEELYEGEIEADTPVCTEGGSFKPMAEYDAFRPHIEKAGSHQVRAEQIRRHANADQRSRLRRRLILGLATLTLAVVGFGATIYFIRTYRSEKIAEEQELALEAKLAQLLDSVSIEPPLILEAPVEPRRKRRRGRRRGKKGKTAPAATASLPKRTGKLSQSEVMAGVGTVFGGFKRCIVKQIQRDPDSVPRKIVLRFTINNSGSVKSPDLDDRILRNSPMMSCMSKQIRSVHFRKFKGEVRNVEYPITIGAH
jgi:hypothetical protein